MTEVLIGDSKLDARNYISSWTGEPAALTEALVGRDTIINKMATSIIGNEDISIKIYFNVLKKLLKMTMI